MDEDKAARPPASPEKPPSARVVTAMLVTTCNSPRQPQAQVIGGGAHQSAESTRTKEETRDVASTQPVKDDAQNCASGCSSL